MTERTYICKGTGFKFGTAWTKRPTEKSDYLECKPRLTYTVGINGKGLNAVHPRSSPTVVGHMAGIPILLYTASPNERTSANGVNTLDEDAPE